jgi:hypothetical protein
MPPDPPGAHPWPSPSRATWGPTGGPPCSRPGAATGYLASDALSAVLWPGGSQVGVLAPAVAWEPTDPSAAATFRISIPASASVALDPGRYDLRVFVTRGGAVLAIEDTVLDFARAAPAVSAYVPPRAYCTYADMTRFAPWIAQVPDLVNEAGLADLRVLARDWTERVILARYQAARGRLTGINGGGNGYYGLTGTPTATADLAAAFARGGLMPTDRLTEMNARYAVGLIGDAQLVPGVKEHDPYAAKAEANLKRAVQLMGGFRAYISLQTPPVFTDPDRVDLIVGEDETCTPAGGAFQWYPGYGYGYGYGGW